MLKNEKVVLIGGAHVDIVGTPLKNVDYNSKNHGTVRLNPGGVAFNIAVNLTKLDVEVSLISVLCDDVRGKIIRSSCENSNISTEESLVLDNSTTPSFMCITNTEGEIKSAISDTGLYEKIEPSFLKDKLKFINSNTVCVLDGNLSKAAIEYLVKNVKIPVFIDPVSVDHCSKVMDSIGYANTIKPNKIEAETLSNIAIKNCEDIEIAGEYFLNKGVQQVFISLDEDGLFFANEKCRGFIKYIPETIKNTNGAGDAMTAGLVYGYLKCMRIEQAAKFSVAIACANLETYNTINENLTIEKVNNILEKIK